MSKKMKTKIHETDKGKPSDHLKVDLKSDSNAMSEIILALSEAFQNSFALISRHIEALYESNAETTFTVTTPQDLSPSTRLDPPALSFAVLAL